MKLDNGSATPVTFKAHYIRDTLAQRTAALHQFWKTYHHRFYDHNFHGRDWSALRDKYLQRLTSVDTNDEFTVLLQMMVGELDASHTEVSPASSGITTQSTPHLGFTLETSHYGIGLKIKNVPLKNNCNPLHHHHREKKEGKKKTQFKRILLTQCQTEFEKSEKLEVEMKALDGKDFTKEEAAKHADKLSTMKPIFARGFTNLLLDVDSHDADCMIGAETLRPVSVAQVLAKVCACPNTHSVCSLHLSNRHVEFAVV